jgi:hypothetical protein
MAAQERQERKDMHSTRESRGERRRVKSERKEVKGGIVARDITAN